MAPCHFIWKWQNPFLLSGANGALLSVASCQFPLSCRLSLVTSPRWWVAVTCTLTYVEATRNDTKLQCGICRRQQCQHVFILDFFFNYVFPLLAKFVYPLRWKCGCEKFICFRQLHYHPAVLAVSQAGRFPYTIANSINKRANWVLQSLPAFK